jgi:hypothetical protein
LSKREEILDMAVHALTPLMAGQPQANAADLFDQSIEIAEKLIEHVDATAENDGAPDRDELLDMGVHAMSALLRGRPSAAVDDLLGECMEVAQKLIVAVDAANPGDADAREELLDMAVHAQTAFLSTRPAMNADDLSAQCVEIAQALTAKVDAA